MKFGIYYGWYHPIECGRHRLERLATGRDEAASSAFRLADDTLFSARFACGEGILVADLHSEQNQSFLGIDRFLGTRQ